MTANPDMNAVYATGEPALVGAVAAVDEPGAPRTGVKVFGWDLTEQAIKGIDDGLVVAVVQQDPAGEGKAAVEAAVTLVNGGKVPPKIDVPVTIVTKENVDKFRADVQVSDPATAPGCGRDGGACRPPPRPPARHPQGLRHASRRCAGSTSTCGRARCWAWSATTAPASRR